MRMATCATLSSSSNAEFDLRNRLVQQAIAASPREPSLSEPDNTILIAQVFA